MNEYSENNYDNDVEIDLADLIFYFLKKWKVLLVAIILGALLGGGFCALRTMSSNKALAESEAKTEKDYDISDKTLNNMEVAYRLRLQYLRQKEYNENSPLMQINPNAFYKGILQYTISAGNDTHKIWKLYQGLVNEYDFYEDLATALGWDEGASYMNELVRVGIDTGSPSIVHVDIISGPEEVQDTDTQSDEDEENLEGSVSESMPMIGDWIITYTVIAEDEESCEKMLEVIRKKVQALDRSCAEEYANYTASQLSHSVQLCSDNEYLTFQKTNIDQMNTNLTNAVKLEDAFTDEELEYYNKVFWNDNEPLLDDTELIVDEGQEEIISSASPAKLSRRSLIRWILLGAFAGVMIWGCCYLIIYLMDSSIKTVGELRDSYHLPLLGHVSVEETGKKSWVDKLYSKVKGTPDTIPYIVSEIDTMEKGPVALCGDKEYGDVQTVMVELAENCDDVSANDFASKSINALEKVKEAGSEILVVRIGKTKRSEIRRELEVCRMQNVKVAGIIAVEDD